MVKKTSYFYNIIRFFSKSAILFAIFALASCSGSDSCFYDSSASSSNSKVQMQKVSSVSVRADGNYQEQNSSQVSNNSSYGNWVSSNHVLSSLNLVIAVNGKVSTNSPFVETSSLSYNPNANRPSELCGSGADGCNACDVINNMRCDPNCSQGQRYLLSAKDPTKRKVTLAKNVLPGDRVTFFIPKINLPITGCSSAEAGAVQFFNDANTNGYHLQPSKSLLLSCLETSAADQLIGGLKQNEFFPFVGPAANDFKTQIANLDTTECSLRSDSTGKWRVAGCGLKLKFGSQEFFFLDENRFTSGATYGLMYEVTNNNTNSNQSLYQQKNNFCRSTTRTFINTTGATIPEITAELNSGASGGYIIYVNHSGCNAENGKASEGSGCSNSGQLMLGVGPVAPSGNNPSPTGFFDNTDSLKPLLRCESDFPEWENCAKATEDKNFSYYYIKGIKKAELDKNYVWLKVKDSTLNYVDNDGAYVVDLYSEAPFNSISTSIANLIKFVREDIYKIVKNSFTNMVCPSGTGKCSCTTAQNCNTTYVGYIRVLLILYITWFGISFLLGNAKISQSDFVIRLVKIGIIFALISEQSWDFFNKYFFQAFLNGTNELVILSQRAGGFSCPDSNPFCFIDYGFSKIFFNGTTWLKLISLFPEGIIMMLILVWAIVMYFIAVIKVIVYYLMAVIYIAALVMVAPIFIPFILFGQTEKMFKEWITNLIRYTIEPVLLLVGFSVLSQLLYVVLDNILDYRVCFGCKIMFNILSLIPLLNIILPKAMLWFCIPFFKAHAPLDSAANYTILGQVSNVLFFIAIVKIISSYTNYIESLMNAIFQQPMGGVGSLSGNATKFTGMVSSAAQKALGIDQQSRNERRIRLEVRREFFKANPVAQVAPLDKRADAGAAGGAPVAAVAAAGGAAPVAAVAAAGGVKE